MRALALGVVFVSLLATDWSGASSQRIAPTTDLARLLIVYRGREPSRAVSELAHWTGPEIESALNAMRDRLDPTARACVALLHTEAGLDRDLLGEPQKTLPILTGAIDELEVYTRTAVNLIRPLADDHRDPRIADFVKGWLAIAARYWPAGIHQLVERQFADDPEMLLLRGAQSEFWAGSEIDSGGVVGFSVSDKGTAYTNDLFTTSHGGFGPLRRDAEQRLRQAITLKPTLAEAHLRLGRLLYLLDRRSEAESALSKAARYAGEQHDVFVGYLAPLFLGRLHEDLGRPDEAERDYRAAMTAYPPGRAAALGLGQLLLMRGRNEEGWTIVRRFTESTSAGDDARDPWSAYGFETEPWQLSEQLSKLRGICQP